MADGITRSIHELTTPKKERKHQEVQYVHSPTKDHDTVVNDILICEHIWSVAGLPAFITLYLVYVFSFA